jgi:hypothetical protein
MWGRGALGRGMGNQQKDGRIFELNILANKKTADFYLKRSRFIFKPERFYRISATSVVDSESN